MRGSSAQGRIDAHLRHSLRYLRRSAPSADADAFEAFLQSAGRLAQPSLILRCRFTEGTLDYRVVVDKPKSQWRVSTQFLPFLDRIRHRIQGHTDVFVLLSDTMYVSGTHMQECVAFLKRVPLLRSDWLDDDPVSSHALTIPDYTLLDAAYSVDIEEIDQAVSAVAFADRQPSIGWRGRLTGPGHPDMDNKHLFPRYRLLEIAAAHPTVLDARLTHPDNFADTAAGRALLQHINESLGGQVEELTPADFAGFKYLVSLDGVTSTWKRVANSLRTGSVLLLQNRWKQFFYPGLVAWEHYVPVADDLSDLLARHEWLVSHPDQAEAIGQQGRGFAQKILSAQAIDDHFVNVLAECAALPRT